MKRFNASLNNHKCNTVAKTKQKMKKDLKSMTNQVIYIDQPNQEKELPVTFEHFLSPLGWKQSNHQPSEYDKVVYLGKCIEDGDMFAAYNNGGITIQKGKLNSGKY